MPDFTDAELAAITVALTFARTMIRNKGSIQAPPIFEAIEVKIMEEFAGDDERWQDAHLEVIDLKYLN